MSELKTAKTVSGLLRSLEEAADADGSHRRDYFTDAITVIEELTVQLSEARKALEPFAKEAGKYDGWLSNVMLFSGSGEVGEEWRETHYTPGHLRHARKIVEATT